jgi:hypothetical protein
MNSNQSNGFGANGLGMSSERREVAVDGFDTKIEDSEWFAQQTELIELKEALQQAQSKQIDLLRRARDSDLSKANLVQEMRLLENILRSEAEAVSQRLETTQKIIMRSSNIFEGQQRSEWRFQCSEMYRMLQVICTTHCQAASNH